MCCGGQAHVFELLDNEGVVAPIVLKASKSRALISDTQREWATGQVRRRPPWTLDDIVGCAPSLRTILPAILQHPRPQWRRMHAPGVYF